MCHNSYVFFQVKALESHENHHHRCPGECDNAVFFVVGLDNMLKKQFSAFYFRGLTPHVMAL